MGGPRVLHVDNHLLAVAKPAGQPVVPDASGDASLLDEAREVGVTAAVRPDAVELSDHALYLARLRELPEVRSELIDRARQSIASGAYASDAVIDATLDRLAEDLDLLG